MAAHQRAAAVPDTPPLPPGLPENFAGGPTHIMARLWAEILKVGPRCHAGDLSAYLVQVGEKNVPLRLTGQLMALRNAGRVAVDADNFVTVTPAFAHLCGAPVQVAPAAPAPPPVTGETIDVLDIQARQQLLAMKLEITDATVAFMRQWLTAQDAPPAPPPVTVAAPSPQPVPEPAPPPANVQPLWPDPVDLPPFPDEFAPAIRPACQHEAGYETVQVAIRTMQTCGTTARAAIKVFVLYRDAKNRTWRLPPDHDYLWLRTVHKITNRPEHEALRVAVDTGAAWANVLADQIEAERRR